MMSNSNKEQSERSILLEAKRKYDLKYGHHLGDRLVISNDGSFASYAHPSADSIETAPLERGLTTGSDSSRTDLNLYRSLPYAAKLNYFPSYLQRSGGIPTGPGDFARFTVDKSTRVSTSLTAAVGPMLILVCPSAKMNNIVIYDMGRPVASTGLPTQMAVGHNFFQMTPSYAGAFSPTMAVSKVSLKEDLNSNGVRTKVSGMIVPVINFDPTNISNTLDNYDVVDSDKSAVFTETLTCTSFSADRTCYELQGDRTAANFTGVNAGTTVRGHYENTFVFATAFTATRTVFIPAFSVVKVKASGSAVVSFFTNTKADAAGTGLIGSGSLSASFAIFTFPLPVHSVSIVGGAASIADIIWECVPPTEEVHVYLTEGRATSGGGTITLQHNFVVDAFPRDPLGDLKMTTPDGSFDMSIISDTARMARARVIASTEDAAPKVIRQTAANWMTLLGSAVAKFGPDVLEWSRSKMNQLVDWLSSKAKSMGQRAMVRQYAMIKDGTTPKNDKVVVNYTIQYNLIFPLVVADGELETLVDGTPVYPISKGSKRWQIVYHCLGNVVPQGYLYTTESEADDFDKSIIRQYALTSDEVTYYSMLASMRVHSPITTTSSNEKDNYYNQGKERSNKDNGYQMYPVIAVTSDDKNVGYTNLIFKTSSALSYYNQDIKPKYNAFTSTAGMKYYIHDAFVENKYVQEVIEFVERKVNECGFSITEYYGITDSKGSVYLTNVTSPTSGIATDSPIEDTSYGPALLALLMSFPSGQNLTGNMTVTQNGLAFTPLDKKILSYKMSLCSSHNPLIYINPNGKEYDWYIPADGRAAWDVKFNYNFLSAGLDRKGYKSLFQRFYDRSAATLLSSFSLIIKLSASVYLDEGKRLNNHSSYKEIIKLFAMVEETSSWEDLPVSDPTAYSIALKSIRKHVGVLWTLGNCFLSAVPFVGTVVKDQNKNGGNKTFIFNGVYNPVRTKNPQGNGYTVTMQKNEAALKFYNAYNESRPVNETRILALKVPLTRAYFDPTVRNDVTGEMGQTMVELLSNNFYFCPPGSLRAFSSYINSQFIVGDSGFVKYSAAMKTYARHVNNSDIIETYDETVNNKSKTLSLLMQICRLAVQSTPVTMGYNPSVELEFMTKNGVAGGKFKVDLAELIAAHLQIKGVYKSNDEEFDDMFDYSGIANKMQRARDDAPDLGNAPQGEGGSEVNPGQPEVTQVSSQPTTGLGRSVVDQANKVKLVENVISN